MIDARGVHAPLTSAHDDPAKETMTAATAQPRVLVVEDEETLLFTLKHNLKREGYQVYTAARGDDGLKLAREQRPDLIVLDLMLPGLDGVQLCKMLRRDTDVPIIMVTALGGESDRVAGLDSGADDYLAKPFGMRELMARVRALLRRSGPRAEPDQGPSLIVSGDIEIDLERREVRRGGSVLRMKPKELELLLFFAQHRGRVFSREQILDEVWGYDFYGGPRTVDVHVRWLRQKIEPDAANPQRLRTVRGSGYIFEG
jgi:DNA-binding response OmpR family regulator